MQYCVSSAALESKLVNQFCEDENGALIYNRITNGGNGHNGYRPNGYDHHNNVFHGNNGYGSHHEEAFDRRVNVQSRTYTERINPIPFRVKVCSLATPIEIMHGLLFNGNLNLIIEKRS